MKKILISVLAVLFTCQLSAQTPYNLSSLIYTQNFNTLDSNATNSSNFPAGWGLYERGTGSSANQMYRSGYGNSNAGDCFSFGSAGSADRALGSIASGSVIATYGFKMVNNTGTPLTSVNISFTGEQWRAGDSLSKLDSLIFSYSTTATGVADTTPGVWVTDTATNMLNSPNPTGAGGTAHLTGYILDGNATANRVSKTITLTGLNIAVGDSITFIWYDWNIGGSDDGLALDDMSIAFNGAVVLPAKPLLVSTTPADNATNVFPTLTGLTATFDNPITLGTGNFRLTNLTDITSVIIPNSNISISGNMATITGASLLPNKDYSVQFDSTLFNHNGTKCNGIYDDITWNFTTTWPDATTNLIKNSMVLQASSWSNQCILSFTASKVENARIDIIGLDGKVVNSSVVKTQSGKNAIVLHTNTLASGLYIIKVNTSNESGVVKFTK